MQCSACGNEVILKSRTRLGLVGALLVGGALAALSLRVTWPLAILLAMTGGYLLVWATRGKGAWCRQCKRIAFR
jgi:uncharacterized membrane protein